VTLTGYRFDEFTPYVYKSTDYGKTWTSVAGNLPMEAANIIKEDHTNPAILYLGTDQGLYVSTNSGKSYELMQGSIPNVAIYDMAIQKRENELVVATHGRSVFIVDLKPLYKTINNPKEVQILSVSEIRYNPWRAAMSEGIVNKPTQNILFYTKNKGETNFEIKNDKDETIKSWSHNSSLGINNTDWEYGSLGRGKYKVILKGSEGIDEVTFNVK
jgi:photosystem II stability/assembly factor-like uncharacterized protein